MSHQENLNRQLSGAVIKGDTASVLDLLQQGADIEAKYDLLFIPGYTPLLLASLFGHTELALDLLARGANIEARDESGTTSLMKASDRCNVELVSALLQAGADPSVTNHRGRTALWFAEQKRNGEAVMNLLISFIEKRRIAAASSENALSESIQEVSVCRF